MQRAVAKVKIDQALIRNPHSLRNRFEIGNGIAIQPHRDRLLQVFDIRVLAPFHLGEIVMVSHRLRTPSPRYS